MDIYDSLINKSLALIDNRNVRVLEKNSAWQEESEQKILLRKDTAYELGKGNLPACSGTAFTSDESIQDEILLCGPDLQQLQSDSPYARFTILRVDDSKWTDNETAYRAMTKIGYTRYHVHPRGFFMRISTASDREPVRVGRAELTQGLSFAGVGGTFLDAYHQHQDVLGVRIIFITQPDFPYEKLADMFAKMEQITESLNEIFHNVVMDCHSCRLKPVCDQVEGMRKLHFSRAEVGL